MYIFFPFSFFFFVNFSKQKGNINDHVIIFSIRQKPNLILSLSLSLSLKRVEEKMSILGTICLDWCALVRFQNLNGIYLYAHVKRFGRSKLKVNVSTRQGWSHDTNGRHFSHLSQV